MIAHLLEATALLSLLAGLPVITVAGLRPASVFLCPLGGSLLAAWAAEFELAAGGSFTSALLIMAVVANGATLLYLLLRRTERLPGFAASSTRRRILSIDPGAPQSLRWRLISLIVVSAAVVLPLRALGATGIGFDANVSWLVHAILVYGGHDAMQSGLHNPVLVLNHADYPPLVPASSATGFVVSGGVDLQIGIATTAVLNACALGVLGSGILEMVGQSVTLWRRIIILAVAAAICLIGFGTAGPFAVDGFADLTWAAPAAAAVVFGLVLPRSSQRLWVAWICLTVAALVKNEGTVAAVIISAALALRYVDPRLGSYSRTWIHRAAAMCVFVIPGLTWSALMRHYRVSSGFFRSVPGETPVERLGPTISATTHYLHLVPVALVVLAVGSLLLRSHRRLLGLGNPMWLWAVAVANLLALIATYVFGAFEIHWWLSSSLNRTIIFTQLILWTDIAIWAVVAALPSPTQANRQPPAEASPVEVVPALERRRSVLAPTIDSERHG